MVYLLPANGRFRSFRRLFALICLLSFTCFDAGCDDAISDATVSPIPDKVLAEVLPETLTVGPSGTLAIEVRIPAARSASVVAAIAGQSAVDLKITGREAGYLIARGEVRVGAQVGDKLITVSGQSDAGAVVGHAVVHSTLSPKDCPSGSIQEAGVCHPEGAGHGLAVLGIATVGIGHTGGFDGPDKRQMMHPREVTILGSATVGCHTDHIGMVWLGDYEWIQDLQNVGEEVDFSELDEGDGTTPVTEALIAEAGLLHCETFKLDRERRIGVVSARGTFGQDGGIATWRIPQTDAPPYDPPVLLDSVLDDSGFEGIALSDDGRTLYAARKPNRLSIWGIDDAGQLALLSDTVVPSMGSAWGVAVQGTTVFMTDPTQHAPSPELTLGPDGTAHYRHAHDATAGRVFAIDVSTPAAPEAIGWNDTAGAAKGIAILPNQTLAVAVGASGVQLFDTSTLSQPMSLGTFRTPSTVNDVDFGAGYLVAADWNSVRLYDAADAGTLRLLDASDAGLHSELLGREIGPDGLPLLPPSGSLALGWAGIQQESGGVCDSSQGPCAFLATDIDRIFIGRIQSGQQSPRIVLRDSRVSVRGGAQNPEETVAIRVSNDGRRTLWVRLKEDEHVHSLTSESLVLGPGEDGIVEAHLSGLDSETPPSRIVLMNNDPWTPERTVNVLVTTVQYREGDAAPRFALPTVNYCDPDGCDFTPRCVDSEEVLKSGKPIFLAFFSSW